MIGILHYKAWLVEPRFAAKMAPILMRSIEQGNFNQFVKQNREANEKIISAQYNGLDAEMIRDYYDPTYYTATSKVGVKVAIVPMMGAITKNGDACSYGMRDYQNVLSKIAKDPAIGGLVIHYNNAPGGSHDGTPEMASILKAYKKSNVGWVDGMAASAHYFMASQQNHIMMNKLTDSEVGSIGSLIVYENIQNQIDAGEYPQIEIIRAPQSYNKALFNSIEPLTDNMRADLNAQLKDVVKGFISAVKSGRGDKLVDDGEMFTGKMYATDDAIKNGLADSKGTLQDAINLAGEMAKSKQGTSGRKPTANTNMSLKSKLISMIFGESGKAEDGNLTAKVESIEAADALAAEMETENSQLKEKQTASEAKVVELEKSVSDLNGQVSTLTSEKTKLTTEKEELEVKLAAAPKGHATTVVAEGDHEGSENPKTKSADQIEAEKYNKAMHDNFL